MANAVFVSTVRVFYEKRGRMRYISHLDMTRCMSRALKRSGLPVWHTQGFNPHIYLTFALPLSLGCESLCESFDFRLTEETGMEEIKERLGGVLPAGLTVRRAAEAVHKPEEIAWADYTVELEYGPGAGQAEKQLRTFLELPVLFVTKKGKAGEKSVDVKPHFSLQGLTRREEILELRLRCAAGQEFNLNPSLLLNAFMGRTGIAPLDTHILRRSVLLRDGGDFN